MLSILFIWELDVRHVLLVMYELQYEMWILEDNHHKILCDAM